MRLSLQHREQGAWVYCYPAKVSRYLQLRLEHVPKAIQDISWKAQVRLFKRYRRLVARGKQVNQVVVAIAREMAAFVWAIAQAVAGAHSGPTGGGPHRNVKHFGKLSATVESQPRCGATLVER